MYRNITIAVLALLALASVFFLNPSSETQQDAAQAPLNEGYYLLDATISDTDENGQLVYALKARRIDHIPADGSVQLNDLKVLYSGEAEDAWTIEARRGSMGATRDRLRLLGDVRIESQDPTSLRRTAILTDQLSLDVARNIASTNQPVRILMEGGELTARGMEADLSAKTIDLLADVRGTFGGSE